MTLFVRLRESVVSRDFSDCVLHCPAQARHADRERTSGGHENQQRRRQRRRVDQRASGRQT